jgi:hypothetical protein
MQGRVRKLIKGRVDAFRDDARTLTTLGALPEELVGVLRGKPVHRKRARGQGAKTRAPAGSFRSGVWERLSLNVHFHCGRTDGYRVSRPARSALSSATNQ